MRTRIVPKCCMKSVIKIAIHHKLKKHRTLATKEREREGGRVELFSRNKRTNKDRQWPLPQAERRHPGNTNDARARSRWCWCYRCRCWWCGAIAKTHCMLMLLPLQLLLLLLLLLQTSQSKLPHTILPQPMQLRIGDARAQKKTPTDLENSTRGVFPHTTRMPFAHHVSRSIHYQRDLFAIGNIGNGWGVGWLVGWLL